MAYKNFDELITFLKQGCVKKKVAVAAAHDEHALEAVFEAASEGLIEPILVGNKEKIKAIADDMGKSIDQFRVVEAFSDEECAKVAVSLCKEGEASILMKGKLQTADLLRQVVNKESGIGCGRCMSHVAFLDVPSYNKLMCVSDGGMIVYPNLEQKRDIILNASDVFHNLGYDCPNVAVLCGVEVVNPKMQETVDAKALSDMKIPGCYVEGPISYDLAMSKEAAEIKGFASPVIGNVDIFVVPNLAAGNILAKGLIHSAGATMAGLIIGASVPIVLTSRGSSAREKYLSIVLAVGASK